VSDFGEIRTVKTRKDRRCEWCGEDIPKGSTVTYFGGMWDGDWQSWHMHPECHKSADLYDFIDGFTPFENKRGRDDAKGSSVSTERAGT
jgi:hypothetical protein